MLNDELLKRGAEARAARLEQDSETPDTDDQEEEALMAVTGISANRLELLQIADAVAREKSIDKEIVIEAIEEAITKGARARYGAEHDIRANIDPRTGETDAEALRRGGGRRLPGSRRARSASSRCTDAKRVQRQGRRGRQGLRGGPAALRVRPGADPDGPPGGDP